MPQMNSQPSPMSWDYMNEQLRCGLRIRYAWAVLPFHYLSMLISWHVDVV